MAAHLFGELDKKAQSLWFSDVSDLCVCVLQRGCAVYQDVWANLDGWNMWVMAVCWG